MKSERFPTLEKFNAALTELLTAEIFRSTDVPRLVMLAGGRTPLAVYQLIADQNRVADANLHLCLSDERMVPTASPESNAGQLATLVAALAVPPARQIFPNTALPLPAAAQAYHENLAAFLKRGGRLSLGLLGLGADGHTASLFALDDVERGGGRYALPVLRASGPNRISVTADFLAMFDRLIFVAAGAGKREIVWRLLHEPETIPAGAAVARAPDVTCWFAE
jgi:6-phosphogluconolactonase